MNIPIRNIVVWPLYAGLSLAAAAGMVIATASVLFIRVLVAKKE